MENLDPEQAARVWSRVRSGPGRLSMEDLEELIRREWEDAAIYLQLSRRCSGRMSGVLYRMFQQEHTHCTCLKGIYAMITGDRPKLPQVNVQPKPIETALRECYGREMRCAEVYEELCAQPEYGYVFCHIRDQERTHCRTLLELIGGLRKG